MSLTADKIAHAPEPLVRAILTALCSDAAVARQAAEFNNKLLTAQYAPAAGTKRKAEDTLMICWQCREAFSQDQNHEKACLFHNGTLCSLEQELTLTLAEVNLFRAADQATIRKT